jgi:uncharacterized transporter YbjL
MCYKPNIVARLSKHSYLGLSKIITYSACVSVALITQYAMRMRRISICGLYRSNW